MILRKIKLEEFEFFYTLLEKDFPFNERKNKEDELKSFNNANFSPSFIIDFDTIIGYLCYWEFDKFIFGEHFAILESLRNKGLGTAFLKSFLEKLSKPLLIEVERPTTNIASRRINFYKRLGFVVTDYNYLQPSYHKDGERVPMYLISNNNKISEKHQKEYISIVNNEVYNLI